MNVFLVTTSGNSAELKKAVEKLFHANDRWRYAPNVWFVASKLKAVQISDALGIEEGSEREGVVIRCHSSYWGIADTNFWDWLQLSFEKKDDGG